MKKMKKLLSVLLAMVMMLSCFSILGSAYSSPENPGEWYYDSNDNPKAYLYTDEQRASAITDLVDGLLKGANIKTTVNLYITKLNVDLTSLNATADTIDSLAGLLGTAGTFVDLGLLEKLDFDDINGDVETTDENGAVAILDMLLDFLNTNAYTLTNEIIRGGEIYIGTLISVDLSAINEIIKNLHNMLGGLVYGLGNRQMTNGIGEDPNWPNSTVWDELESKPTMDALLDNLIDKLLFQPNNTIRITDRSENTLGAQAIEEVLEDGTKNYYCYGTETAEDGTVTLITTYEGEEEPYRHYLTRWDENSALIKGASAEQLKAALDLRGKTLYDLLEDVIPWAYDAFGGHNLDGQLRATLMQFCGAFNDGNVDAATQETLKAKVLEYKAIEENANGAKYALRDTFKNATGAAGNYNFMYISLSGADINTKPDDLYYVVEWGGSWQYYHVVFDEYVSNFFNLIDWEYQAPMWSEIATTVGLEADKSILNHINDIAGTILTSALKTFSWTAGTQDGALAGNVTELVKLVIKTDTRKLFGSTYTLPEDFDSYTLEQVVVELATLLVPKLMPALILPEDVSSVEEVIAYCLREVMADYLPATGDSEYSWDAALAAASTEDDFLNIALSMGTSLGVYYLNNLIGVGTWNRGNNTTEVTVFEDEMLDARYDWRTKLNYVIEWIRAAYLDRLDDNVVAKFSDAMNGSDPLLKLSAIFSTIMPSFVKILGADDDTYAINLNTVYNDLRKALDGDFSGLCNGLERDGIAADASGNKSAIQAIGTLIVELFGGLGFDTCGSNWTTLSGYFTTAMADTATPLTTLLGADWSSNDKIASLAEYLIKCLAPTRDIWGQNALTLVLSFLLGYEKELSYSLVDSGVRTAYAGSETATIDYNFKLDVSGVRSYFNTGRYKSGTGVMDGTYSATVVNAKAFNANGEQVATTAINAALAANESVDVTVSVPAPSTPEVYTLITYVRVKLPSQTTDANNELMEFKRQFIITSQENDSMTPSETTFTDHTSWVSNSKLTSGSNATTHTYKLLVNARWEVTNTYINETEPLSKAAETLFTLYANNEQTRTETSTISLDNHTYTKFYMNNFGYSRGDIEEGKIKITTEAENTTLQDLTTRTPATLNGTSLSNDELQNLWFKWNLNNQQPQTGYDAGKEVSSSAAIWQVETGANRDDYKENFYTYKVTANDLRIEANYNAMSYATIGGFSQESKGYSVTAPSFTSYVVLYNSYGLEAIMDDALTYEKENYDTTSTEGAAAWAAFEAARTNAMNQLYGTWKAEQFATNHTTTSDYAYTNEDGEAATLPSGSSTFELAGIMLEEAMADLADYVAEDTESSADEEAVYDPSNANDPYHAIYLMLQEQNDKKLHDDDWVGYRWFEYWDDYNIVASAMRGLTAPEKDAPSTLVGLEALGSDLDAALATIADADIKAIADRLVEAPTEDAIKAYADAYQAFLDGYDAVLAANPIEALLSRAEQMTIDGTPYTGDAATGRLLAKYDSNEYYWLEKALTDYGNVTNDDAKYSEESYKKYDDARNYANEVLAAAKNNTSSQYVIFSARYELLVAYKALILAEEEVDMSALKDAMAEAQEILDAIGTDDERQLADDATAATLDEAYEQLLLALGYKVTYANEYDEDIEYFIGGNYNAEYALAQEGMILSIKQQGWVDGITENLKNAIANFVGSYIAPILSGILDTTGFVDTVNKYVYGIDLGGIINEFFQVENGTMNLVANALGFTNGTGATLEVVDTKGEVVDTYTVVIFGDVDGNAEVTADDYLAVIAATQGIALDGAYAYASDVDASGGATADDYLAIIAATQGIALDNNPYVE